MGRRERERVRRRELIVRTARELAEAEGWAAVTTRRLAELIEFSQPVLYTHFAGKDAIIAVVAERGFVQLTEVLAAARAEAAPYDSLRAVAAAYLEFADTNPAVYDGMFNRAVSNPFASAGAAEPQAEAFAQLRAAVAPFAGARDPALLAEVLWSALHGLIILTRDGRLSEERREERLTVIAALITA
jgi:AcrR family transcriptional regulator